MCLSRIGLSGIGLSGIGLAGICLAGSNGMAIAAANRIPFSLESSGWRKQKEPANRLFMLVAGSATTWSLLDDTFMPHQLRVQTRRNAESARLGQLTLGSCTRYH